MRKVTITSIKIDNPRPRSEPGTEKANQPEHLCITLSEWQMQQLGLVVDMQLRMCLGRIFTWKGCLYSGKNIVLYDPFNKIIYVRNWLIQRTSGSTRLRRSQADNLEDVTFRTEMQKKFKYAGQGIG
jgi:hypothetical protein